MLIKIVREGERLRIGDRTLTLARVHSQGHGVFETDAGEEIEITSAAMTEVFPDVRISAHQRGPFTSNRIRLAIDAPRSVLIGEEPS